jgi:hypothetical protein
MKRSSSAFVEELREVKPPPPDRRSRLGDRLDERTREQLERLRRGRG